jgi:hypothetical protein
MALATLSGQWSTLANMFFVVFAAYILVLAWIRKKTFDFRAALIVVLFAIVFRLTLLFAGPVFSFDMYRYYWDGKVAASGINPYLYPPDAAQLSNLRDPVWELINHKYLRTGYPPLMEMLFQLLYVLFKSAFVFKVTFFLLDLTVIVAVFLILRQLRLDSKYLVVYAWAPLPILEITQTGHNDSLVVFFVLLSFLFMLRERNSISAGLMGLAVSAKLYPLFFAPVLFKRWGFRGVLIFAGVIAALYVPYLGVGVEVFRGILYAINTTFFNGSFFPAITTLWTLSGVTDNPGFAAQLVTYATYIILVLWGLRVSWRSEHDAVRLMRISFLLTGALILLNRSFFPWYVTWFLPFVSFFSSMAWLGLSGSIFLGYLKYDSFPPPPYEAVSWQLAMAIDLVQYVPFYAILLYELAKNRIALRVG